MFIRKKLRIIGQTVGTNITSSDREDYDESNYIYIGDAYFSLCDITFGKEACTEQRS